MAYTTQEKIRVEAGFQTRFNREKFINSPDGVTSKFYVRSDSYVKFIPEFGTGNTIAGVSDVQVFVGLSGINGLSRMSVSSIDINEGSVVLGSVPALGTSLTITYSSSGIPSLDLENVRLEAEALVNQRLSRAYAVPFGVTISHITNVTTKLAAAYLMMRNYGTGNRDTAADGYALYKTIVGDNQYDKDGNPIGNLGELGTMLLTKYTLVDDNGNIIPRIDTDDIVANNAFVVGGLNGGRLYDISEEPFRKKDYRDGNNNANQSGSGLPLRP